MDTTVKIPLDERAAIDAADFKAASIFYETVTNFWDLSEVDALDAFARDGSLTVCNYFDSVRGLDLWEFQPEMENALRAYDPTDVIIGDSFRTVVDHDKKYGFIVVDTPQGLYNGGGMTTAEHFDFINLMDTVMEDRCVVVLYVNSKPYNKNEIGSYGREDYPDTYDFDKWMAMRQEFYHLEALGAEVTPEIAIKTYRRVFRNLGFSLETVLLGPCYSFAPGLPKSFRLALELVKL